MAPKEVRAAVATQKKEETTEKTEEELKDEAKEEEEKEPKAPEAPKELEEDAPAIKGAKAKDVTLNFDDSTLNVMPCLGGKLLRTLSEGGMQHLLASVRSNAGIKSGRYMFEVRIVETLNPAEPQGEQPRTAQSRQLVRVGFSLAGSSLFLADGASNFCFDSEGFFLHDKLRKRVGHKFSRDQTVAVLLNLDSASPNKNTVSLFVNGVRVSQPQPLPEELCGKTLFPTISYKNVSLEVNLGPTALKPLPFTCHMLAGAAAADVEVAKPAKAGKAEVVFPVGLPEQGFFDWVDEYVEKNPSFVELSDRKILEWASKSGVVRPKGNAAGSNDKPEGRTGIPGLDDGSVRRVLSAICPTLSRNFIVPELNDNLVPGEREAALMRFNSNDFKRKAVVIMGEPSKEYKERVHSLVLAEKKVKAEAEHKRKVQEAERKRQIELRKKKAEEARKAKEAAKKKEEEATEEGAEAQEAEEPKEEEEEEDAKMEEEAPVVELSEEEKKLCYRKSATPDLTEKQLAKSYASYALPKKAEGFDEVTFAWQKEAECAKMLKSWVLEKKLTQRAEELQPGEAFKESWSKWQKTVQEWRKMQSEWKDPQKRKAAAAKKVAEAKKKIEEEKQKLTEAGDEDAAKALEESAVKEAEPMEIDLEELDVMAVEDVKDIGNGMPLFADFVYEDWVLLGTRYELHLLIHSFKKDLNDSDRPSFAEKHLGFYYQRYFKKAWNFKQFNIETFEDFLDLIKDTVGVDSASGFLKATQAEDAPLEMFVKITEDSRRDLQRRVDAGDETARLKFSKPAAPYKQDGNGNGKGGAQAKGYGKGGNGGAARPAYGGGAGYGGGAYAGQKRPAPTRPAPGYGAPAKQARTTYGSYGGR